MILNIKLKFHYVGEQKSWEEIKWKKLFFLEEMILWMQLKYFRLIKN